MDIFKDHPLLDLPLKGKPSSQKTPSKISYLCTFVWEKVNRYFLGFVIAPSILSKIVFKICKWTRRVSLSPIFNYVSSFQLHRVRSSREQLELLLRQYCASILLCSSISHTEKSIYYWSMTIFIGELWNTYHGIPLLESLRFSAKFLK